MSEVQAMLLTGFVFIIGNIVGWTWNLHKNSKQQGFFEGRMEQHIKDIDDRLSRIERKIFNSG